MIRADYPLFVTRVIGVLLIKVTEITSLTRFMVNKTKYFKLRLFDEKELNAEGQLRDS